MGGLRAHKKEKEKEKKKGSVALRLRMKLYITTYLPDIGAMCELPMLAVIDKLKKPL